MSDDQKSQLLNNNLPIMTTNNNGFSNSNNNTSILHNLIQYNPLHQSHNQYSNSYLNNNNNNNNELSVQSNSSLSSSPTCQSTIFSSPTSFTHSPNTFENTTQNTTHPTYSVNSNNKWVKMSECDEFIGPKRSKHTMITHGNFLYVFGGDNGKQMLNDLITYDCTNNSWGRALNSNPPTPRYHHSAVVYNNSMFVFGGYTGDLNSNSNLCNKNDLIEYRISSGTWVVWNTEYKAPAPRAAHGAVVYNSKMIIFAGYDGNCRLNDMWSIPLNTPYNAPKIWSEIEQFGDQPSTVCNFPLVVVENRKTMYLFSGQSGAKTSNLLFEFDFKSSSWSKISSNFILRGTNNPPDRRSGHIMIAHRNHLYIYGGVLGNNFFHDIYSFDLDNKSWDLITMNPGSQIPTGRSFLGGVVYKNSLYVFGGNGDQNTRSNELFSFKLPDQPKSTLKDDFHKILKKELCCDLEFLCSNKEIVKAHCAIVACRSSYCRQLIKLAKPKLNVSSTSSIQDCEDQSKLNSNKPPFILPKDQLIQIKLDEEIAHTVSILLEFLYTDRIISLEGKENEFETIRQICDVYKLANKFMVAKLKKLCENFIDASITCANVLSLLQYINKLNLATLKELCMKFLSKDSNFNQVIMLSEFESLEKSLMVEIIRLKQTPKKYINSDHMTDLISSRSLEEDMEIFFNSEIGIELADLIISNESSKPMYGHKCILLILRAARCSYFEAFFRSFTPKENKIMMSFGDIIPPRQACQALLKYIYYDDVTNIQTQDALYLFSASHYFQFSNDRLHVFCKQKLEANVSKDNVFDILEVSDKIKDDYMKNFSLKIIRINFIELARSIRIQKLSKELLLDILIDLSDALNNTSNINSNNLTITSSSSNGVYLNNLAGLSSLQLSYQQFLYNNNYLNDDSIMSQK